MSFASRLVSFLIVGLLALFASTSAPMAQAQAPAVHDIVGVWRTIDDRDGKPRGLIRIEQRDGVYVGFTAGSLRGEPKDARCVKCKGSLHNAPIMDLQILSALHRRADGVYVGGRILDPDNGNVYDCRVTLSADGRSLELRGFLGIAALGRTQRWERT